MSDLREVYETNEQDYLAPYLLEAINRIELLQDVVDAAIDYRGCHWIRENVEALDGALKRWADALADTQEQRDCDNCEITGLRCPIRNEQEFTFPCEHWQPLADTQEKTP